MNRFFEKTRGSISVLLAIILLPSLMFSGVLIDIANRHMSKAMLESAGELAASSALANYDAVLEDVYGLFAMSQDYEDLQKNVNQYINDTLSAAGLLSGGDTGSDTLNAVQGVYEDFMGSVSGDDLSRNFIDLSAENVQASGVASSSLANTSVMKNQIVEFMKYRGVQLVAQDLLSTLNQFKTLDEKTTVAKEKMEVAEEMEDLSDAAQAFYKAIVKLDDDEDGIKAVEDAYNSIKNKWGVEYQAYYDFTTNQVGMAAYASGDSMFAYLYNANDIIVRNIDAVDLNDYATYYIDIENNVPAYPQNGDAYQYTRYTVKDIDDSSNRPITSGVSKAYDRVESGIIEAYSNMKNALDTVAQNGSEYFAIYNATQTQDAMTMLRFQNEYELYGDFIRYAILFTSYLAVAEEKILDFESRDELSDDETEEYVEWNALYNTWTNNFKGLLDSPSPTESKSLRAYVEASGYAVIGSEYKKMVKTARTNIGKNIYNAQQVVKPYYDAIKGVLDKKDNSSHWWKHFAPSNYLEYVLSLGEEVLSSIDSLETANNQFSSSVGTYENAVGGADDYSAQMKSEAAANKAMYTREEVQELIDQIKAIKAFLESEKERLEGGTIYEKEFDLSANYSDYEKTGKEFLKAAKSVLGGMEQVLSSVNDAAAYTFVQYVKVSAYRVDYTKDAYTKKISEVIVLPDGTQVGVPAFYLYLAQTYEYPDDQEEDSSGKDNMEKAGKKNADSVSANTSGVKGSGSDFSVLKTTSDSESVDNPGTDTALLQQLKAYGDIFSGLVGVCKNLGSLNGRELRDDLFVTTYIYENFSNYTDSLSSDSARKTMTGVDINDSNNKLLGCEAEYILYGNRSDPKQNIDVVKGNIFAIRFVSNSIFAISDGTINAYTLYPALAIQAATLGVFPYKVAQVVLDLCLALAETIYDMNEIMDGEKIPLFKNKQTWVCQPSGVEKILEDAAVEQIEKASDNLMNDLQEIVNNTANTAATKVSDMANNVTTNVRSTLEGYLEQAVGSLSQIIASELNGILTQVYTGQGADLSRSAVESKLISSLDSYINSAEFGEPVKTFLREHERDIVKEVMDTSVEVDGNSVSVSSLIEKVKKEYDQLVSVKEGDTVTIEVNASYFNDLLKAVSESLAEYIEGLEETIDNTVTKWTSDVAGEVSDTLNNYVEEGVTELKAGAEEAVSGFINDTVGEYFPKEAELDIDTEGTGSGGALGDMFKFGYTDYLRLFLFLGVNKATKENSMLSRIGDVITINRRLGLAAYNSSNGVSAAGDGYSMSKAYTYVTISASATVRPVILGSAFFADEGNALSDASSTIRASNFWKYTYSTTAGY